MPWRRRRTLASGSSVSRQSAGTYRAHICISMPLHLAEQSSNSVYMKGTYARRPSPWTLLLCLLSFSVLYEFSKTTYQHHPVCGHPLRDANSLYELLLVFIRSIDRWTFRLRFLLSSHEKCSTSERRAEGGHGELQEQSWLAIAHVRYKILGESRSG